MMKRRKFLLGGVGFVAVVGLGGIAFGPLAAESEIVAHVRSRLSFLKLDEAGLAQFAKDQVGVLLAKRPTWNRLKYHFMSVFSKSFTRFEHSTDTRNRRQRMEDTIAQTYLLSSDFFINGADQSRTVQYMSFYDPLRGCGNPFARPVIDTRQAS
jgi:hypothetical protein